jgi:ABC-type multidrug transport system fused ATPase/permease subunit
VTRLPVADRPAVRRALAGLVGHQRRAVASVLALHAAATVAGLAAPWLLGRIVDAVTHAHGTGVVDRYALGIVGCVVVQGLLSRYAQYQGHRVSERVIATLREDFVDRTLRLPIGVVERAGTGDLATRSSVDVSTVGTTVREVLPIMAVASAQLLLLFGAIFLLSPWLGLAAVTGLPSISIASRWYLRRASAAYLAEGAATAELTDTLTATAEGTRTIEALGLGTERVRAGTDRVAGVWQARMATLRLRSVLFPVVEASYAVPIAVVLLAGGLLLDHRLVTLGAVVAAALYLQQAIEPLDRVLQWMEQAQRGWASLARVLGVGLVPPEPHGVAAHPDGFRIEARDVRFAYPGPSGGEHAPTLPDVLHGVDLSVRPGERLAVVGPSGAGKSTLARVLAGLDAPRTGTVTIGGVPVTDLPPATRRAQIALLTQEHHVFLGTLRDNLAFAAPRATDEDMRAALRTVGADWYDDLPDGLDTALGDGVRDLSAADAQQIALARLVLSDPHTLILDEATAALDPTTARRTERALAAVLTGRTVIAVAHRLNTAHDADRVAVMEAGRVIELASHDELLAAGGAYAELWRSWHGQRAG